LNLLNRLFPRATEPQPDSRQERTDRVITHQWRAHTILSILSDIENVLGWHLHRYALHDHAKDLAERDAVAEVVARFTALDPYISPYPDDPFDRVNIAEAALAAIAATLADPAMADKPADQCSDIRYYVKKDWHDSRREQVPDWYRRPGTGTYYA
jgi:PIN domain nuclease of toxin-antitoxin system